MAAKAKKQLTEQEKAKIQKEKRERFVKIAPKRANRAIKAIQGLARCAGSGYVYTPKESNAIVEALKREVNTLALAFAGEKRKTAEFSLPAD